LFAVGTSLGIAYAPVRDGFFAQMGGGRKRGKKEVSSAKGGKKRKLTALSTLVSSLA